MYLYRRAALQERLHTETNYMYTIKKEVHPEISHTFAKIISSCGTFVATFL